METYADLLDCIDLSLHSDTYAKDVRRAAEIGIELCELVRSELDPMQTAALEVAKRYWEGNGSEQERVKSVQAIAERLDRSQKSIEVSGRENILNRLVFCALNANTGLSVLAGEYLAELAEALRLPAKDVSNAFSRRVPNFGLKPSP
jgi:hypothetical protein